MAHKKMEHMGRGHKGDPMVGGESEKESHYWGKGEHSNMPQETRMKAYPRSHEAGPGVLDDTMGTVDSANMQAHGMTRKHLSNQH